MCKAYACRKYIMNYGAPHMLLLFRNTVTMVHLLMTLLFTPRFILFLKICFLFIFFNFKKWLKLNFHPGLNFSNQMVVVTLLSYNLSTILKLWYITLFTMSKNTIPKWCYWKKASTHCGNMSHFVMSCLCSKLFVGWSICYHSFPYKPNNYTYFTNWNPYQRLLDFNLFNFWISAFSICPNQKKIKSLNPKLIIVFIVYSSQNKRYKHLHPSTGSVYISRQVLFDESEFPFEILLMTTFLSYR